MKPGMLAEMTDLMSRVGRANPNLVQDRNVALFIQACIEEVRGQEALRNRGQNFAPREQGTNSIQANSGPDWG